MYPVMIVLDEQYSTTRLLLQEKPLLTEHAEDKIKTVLFLPEISERIAQGGLRTQGYFKHSYFDKPLITVVTVVYNGEQYLDQTIRSVIEQDYDNVEYIIIDGGSTDGTLEIIQKYEEQIDYWICEPDSGIYDAMNKGVSLASGEYIAFLNADDYYFSQNTLNIISINILRKNVDVIYGDMHILNENDERKERAHYVGIKYGWFPYSMYWIWIRMVFGHPASFTARKRLIGLGGFSESFKIAADYDFFIRLFVKNGTFQYVPEVLAVFREGGVSTTNLKLLEQENLMVLSKNNYWIALIVSLLRKAILSIKKIF